MSGSPCDYKIFQGINKERKKKPVWNLIRKRLEWPQDVKTLIWVSIKQLVEHHNCTGMLGT
jgi:hypothetical protein